MIESILYYSFLVFSLIFADYEYVRAFAMMYYAVFAPVDSRSMGSSSDYWFIVVSVATVDYFCGFLKYVIPGYYQILVLTIFWLQLYSNKKWNFERVAAVLRPIVYNCAILCLHFAETAEEYCYKAYHQYVIPLDMRLQVYFSELQKTLMKYVENIMNIQKETTPFIISEERIDSSDENSDDNDTAEFSYT